MRPCCDRFKQNVAVLLAVTGAPIKFTTSKPGARPIDPTVGDDGHRTRAAA